MELLSVKNLSKKYEKFELRNASFRLESGYIMGFIGRNGAGKTTTLKSMLGLVHPSGGEVRMMGRDFFKDEFYCKQHIGVVFGGVDYYPRKKLSTITQVTRRFYPDWDEACYRSYLKRFELDEDQRIRELSNGMRVKYALTLALSHNAKLLLLDEPTSGLDPVSRDDLLELFQELIEDGEHSILFSTHITSDLEKCADYITYIKDGQILASTERDAFTGGYKLVSGTLAQLSQAILPKLIGIKRHAYGFNAMIRTEDLALADGLAVAPANLENIMIHIEKEERV